MQFVNQKIGSTNSVTSLIRDFPITNAILVSIRVQITATETTTVERNILKSQNNSVVNCIFVTRTAPRLLGWMVKLLQNDISKVRHMQR